MNEAKNPENTGELQEIRDEKGKFVKGVSGNPLGKPAGTKNKFSPVAKIQEIWEANPDNFDDFINKYLTDPRNRQHIVEMVEGKTNNSETQVALQINQYTGTPEQEQEIDEYVVKRVNELLAQGKLKIVDGKVIDGDL